MDASTLITKYDIIGTPGGFLVGSGIGSDYVEVLKKGSKHVCECFISRIDSEGRCEHIEAVESVSLGCIGDSLAKIDQTTADFYLGQIANIEESIQQNKDSAETQIKQIEDWRESIVAKDERKKSYFVASLDAWMRSSDLKTKSLVHGVVKLRQQQPEIVISDEGEVLQDSRFVRTIPEKRVIDKSSLRKHLMNTGEEIPGTCVNQREPKFSYTTNHQMEAHTDAIR